MNSPRNLRPGIPTVSRVNRRVFFAGLSVIVVLLAGGILFSTRERAGDRPEPESTANKPPTNEGPFDALPDYEYWKREQPKEEVQPQPEPPIVRGPVPIPAEPDPERQKRLAALRKELEEAIASPPTWGVSPPKLPESYVSARKALDTSTSAQTLEVPGAPNKLMAGSVIPAILLTKIISDLEGMTIAQVLIDIYSTTGETLLIPKGTRVVGNYGSGAGFTYGQNRLVIHWERLIFPDGKSVNLPAFPAADDLGASGVHDIVDHHLLQWITATAFSTSIALGGNYAANRSRDEDDQYIDVVGQTIAQRSAELGNRIFDRQLDRPPTIVIRPGYQFNIMVTDDLTLTPYATAPTWGVSRLTFQPSSMTPGGFQ